ncbi:MAG: UDP-N-acetylmuramoyl-L-alanyl-D-glutamate--2,6-diaminopimelate ligase [Patescibacteria group bacterium]|nr:UDP-N-acetylmuramoyl-L-alanyl-D-glutamate--2,6-diaminopimelate ligase [Patescibacteria group bacterium]
MRKVYHYLISILSYWRYGRPARQLIVVGVTGTKGKSTTARLIASVLESAGHKVGLLSTVEFQIGDQRWPNDKKMTMLGRGQIQKMLREMVRAGCRYAVVETSSEGILQYRHFGLHYDVAVFTNLGAEHSERHGGFENLKNDKGKMFAGLGKEKRKTINGQAIKKIIIANTDDAHAPFYLNFPADEKWSYGIKNSELRTANYIKPVSIEEVADGGYKFQIQNSPFQIHLDGAFNVYNALAAVAVGRAQGIPDDTIARGLSAVAGVPGRMEFIKEGQPFKVVVDYAHEPMSLTELFSNLRRFAGNKGKIISVVGSDGGGRDKNKRKEMGRIAGELTDMVIITDVNCYDEDPAVIAEMVAAGVRSAGKRDGADMLIQTDRKSAIAKAIAMAEPDDVVAITAKGTEPFIAVAHGKKIPWDDRAVVREVLKSHVTR